MKSATIFVTIMAAMIAATGGCTSTWEQAYRSTGVAAPAQAKDAPVLLREVPWSRVQEMLAMLERERAMSDIHPDEWSIEQKQAAHAQLLRCLQISEDPETVQVLGRSTFRTTTPTRPDDGKLTEFAREVGATMVVWTSTYLGKAETVVQEPVTDFRGGSSYYSSRGRRHYDAYSGSGTIWVPVVVEADEYAWMAYFLRTNARLME